MYTSFNRVPSSPWMRVLTEIQVRLKKTTVFKMKFITKIILFPVLVLEIFLSSGCELMDSDTAPKHQLLIYSGITMIGPMTELIKIFQRREDCEVIITKGGSGNLLHSIKVNKIGDLYLPGSDTYIKKAQQEGWVTDSVHVGYNKAIIIVQKGNPKKLSCDVDILTHDDLYVVIGNPESGSIGKQTKSILTKAGIFNEVVNNAHEFTTDSKDLALALKNKTADVTINWYAVTTWPEYKPYISSLGIPPEYAQKKKITLGLLALSKEKKLAKKFMKLAGSEEGRKIFNKYGLYDMP